MGRVTCRVLSCVKNQKNSEKIHKMQVRVYRKSIIFSFFSSFFSSLFFFPRPEESSRKCRTEQSTCERNAGRLAGLPHGLRAGSPARVEYDRTRATSQRNRTVVRYQYHRTPGAPIYGMRFDQFSFRYCTTERVYPKNFHQ